MSKKRYRNYAEGGASFKKNTLKSWQPNHQSAKKEIDANLELLRSRASSLFKNSPIGSALINTFESGVIGSGLKLFPRPKAEILGLSAQEARLWSRQVKEEFLLWSSEPLNCDYQRRNNFLEMQRIIFTSHLVDGDSFCLFRRRQPTSFRPYSLRLQLIDSLRVSNPIEGNVLGAFGNAEMIKLGSDNRIVNGIEVDSDGALEAIWISNHPANEFDLIDGLKWQRVRWLGEKTGCRNILHICFDTRPDQFRGVPLLAPVIESMKQIARYADAELTSSIIRTFFSLFFVQPVSNNDLNKILGEKEDEEELDVTKYKLGAGSISSLPKGVDVKSVAGQNAQSTFEPFINSFIKQIGAAVGLPYEVLLKNFQSSYSASRAALLQAENVFRERRRAFTNDFCQPIYEQFLMEAIATGRINAPNFFDDPLKRQAWLNAEWYSEKSGVLDPKKEVDAQILRLQNGLSTYERELAETSGEDFNDVMAQLAQEREILRRLYNEKILDNESRRGRDG